jgi:hypothetical protein
VGGKLGDVPGPQADGSSRIVLERGLLDKARGRG